jgi:hypothetical protein
MPSDAPAPQAEPSDEAQDDVLVDAFGLATRMNARKLEEATHKAALACRELLLARLASKAEALAKAQEKYEISYWCSEQSLRLYHAERKRAEAAEAALAECRAALQPQPSADDAAVLDDFEDAVACISSDKIGPSYTKARAAALARMSVKVPPQWTPCSTDDHAQGYAAGFNACREQVLQGRGDKT